MKITGSLYDSCLILISNANILPLNSHLVQDSYQKLVPISKHKDSILSFAKYFVFLQNKYAKFYTVFPIDPIKYLDYEDFVFAVKVLIEFKVVVSVAVFTKV